MDENRLKLLLQKYQDQRLTAEEQAELDEWFHMLNLGGTEFDEWLAQFGGEGEYVDNRFEEFNRLISPKRKIAKLKPMHWPVAASILMLLSVGAIFLLGKRQPQLALAKVQIHNIAPAGNKAILTLSNGQKIVLNNKMGQIASQSGAKVLIAANGQLSYSEATVKETAYNTLTVPIGNRRDVVLPDGTQVSLDAGSSLTYPVAFTGKDRRISMTGEACVTVKYDPEHPFYIAAKGQLTKDIGTQFNINAYDDEAGITTTLIEGGIEVSAGNKKAIKLKPGQQSVLAGDHIEVSEGNPLVALAWKNGFFRFNDQDITSIMRQLARWYDMQVVYEGTITNEHFNAKISRYKNISEVLNMLEKTKGVQFKVEGRRVTVLNKS